MRSNDPLEVLAHQIANETGLDMSKAFQVAGVLSEKIHKIMYENEELESKLLAITYNADEHGQALSHLEALQKNYDSLERGIDICIDDFNKADKGRIKSEAEVKALQKENGRLESVNKKRYDQIMLNGDKANTLRATLEAVEVCFATAEYHASINKDYRRAYNHAKEALDLIKKAKAPK